MNFRKIKLILILLALVLTGCGEETSRNFISAKNGKLYDGKEEFRFLSFNIPNLNFVEDEMEFTKRNAFRLPTSFEINDALETIKQCNGSVARLYTFPVKGIEESDSTSKYVLGPGIFNEKAFLVMDTVLAIANEKNIRLIIPFLNNWKWMGGIPQYEDFRGKAHGEFWKDSLLISDFKQTINYVLNRKNSITGIKYKNDKSILCWETGNELVCPYSWTKEIASYIKSIDDNHLLMDGRHSIDGLPIPEESITDTNIDIVTSHHYELSPQATIDHINYQVSMINGRKPYIVGEFGFFSPSAIEKISNNIIDKGISGGLIWSLRYHREEGGFYWHSEPQGNGIYKALHFPGFESGNEYNEKEFFRTFRKSAFRIKGMVESDIELPKAPILLKIDDVAEISWKGSVGAEFYNIQRSENTSKWKNIALNVRDANKIYNPLFFDKDVRLGKSYFYRIQAENVSGKSEYSNIEGPIKVDHFSFIDEMKSLNGAYSIIGKAEIKTDDDRKFKEIKYRLETQPNTEILYYVKGDIQKFYIRLFSLKDDESIEISISKNGKDYETVEANRISYFSGEGNYDYWIPIEYKYVNKMNNKFSYLKIVSKHINQFTRVKIDYVP